MMPLAITYLQPYFSALGTLPKSFTGAFSSNSRLDVCELLSKICKSVIEIFWDEVFRVRNTVKTGQSSCLPVIYRKRSAFEMQFYLIVVSIVFKTCVKDHGDSFSRLLEKRI